MLYNAYTMHVVKCITDTEVRVFVGGRVGHPPGVFAAGRGRV